MSKPDIETTYNLLQESDPSSVVNLVWPELRSLILSKKETFKQFFSLSELTLRKRCKPDPTLSMLRVRFWGEYDRAVSVGETGLNKKNLIAGICSEVVWDNRIMRNELSIAYILTPPPQYEARMGAMHNLALDEMGTILAMPVEDSEGKVDHKLMALKLKIFEMVDQRLKGAVTQRVQIDQRVVTQTLPSEILDATDVRLIDASLQRVQAQIEEVKALPMVRQTVGSSCEGVIDIREINKVEALLEGGSEGSGGGGGIGVV